MATDALSRQPLFNEMEVEHDATEGVYRLRATYSSKVSARDDLQLVPLFQAAANDPEYQEVVKFVREGSSLDSVPTEHPARIYKHVLDSLSVLDDEDTSLLVVDFTRIVIPQAARKQILADLHLSHAGFARTKATARE